MVYDLVKFANKINFLFRYDDIDIAILVLVAFENCSVNEVMDNLRIAHRTTLYHLKKLEGDKLIIRKRDGLFKKVYLTKKGKNLLKQYISLLEEALDEKK
jgi:predicted transcriptional regulator